MQQQMAVSLWRSKCAQPKEHPRGLPAAPSCHLPAPRHRLAPPPTSFPEHACPPLLYNHITFPHTCSLPFPCLSTVTPLTDRAAVPPLTSHPSPAPPPPLRFVCKALPPASPTLLACTRCSELNCRSPSTAGAANPGGSRWRPGPPLACTTNTAPSEESAHSLRGEDARYRRRGQGNAGGQWGQGRRVFSREGTRRPRICVAWPRRESWRACLCQGER